MKKTLFAVIAAMVAAQGAHAGVQYKNAYAGLGLDYSHIEYNKDIIDVLKNKKLDLAKDNTALDLELGVKFATPVAWYNFGVNANAMVVGENESSVEFLEHKEELKVYVATYGIMFDNYFRINDNAVRPQEVLFGIGYDNVYQKIELEETGEPQKNMSKNIPALALRLGYSWRFSDSWDVLALARVDVPLKEQNKLIYDEYESDYDIEAKKSDFKYMLNIGIGVRYNF